MALQMIFQNLAALSANFSEFVTENAEKVLNMG
jgi:hypothetical protein